jgi:hypothetical protein
MKLSETRVDRLAAQIVDTLADRDDVRLNAGDAKLLHAVTRIMVDELMVEERIEAEVRDLLDQYRNDIAAGRLNRSDLYTKIKARLVRERGAIL